MMGAPSMVKQVEAWTSLWWLRHGFSTRHGGVSTVYQRFPDADSSGDLNLGWTKDDDPGNVAENRRRLVGAVMGHEAAAATLITLRQVHSALSLVVPWMDAAQETAFTGRDGRALLEADGLMTAAAGPLLGIQTADCVPVLVVDTRLRVVANFHAGWRGTAARIVEVGIAKMTSEFGCRPEHLMAAIGPSIGACCYSVGDEVRDTFASRFDYGAALFTPPHERDLPLHLDLWQANRRQLLDAGIAPERISVAGECTGCFGLPGQRRYFSHRCEQGFTGRMMSVIGITAAAAI